MAINFTYDNEHQVITAQVHGDLLSEDIERVMGEVLSSKEIPSNANTLWDLTEMNFDTVDLELQQKIVKMRTKFDLQRGDAKIAIVSNYPLGDVLVKLFLILMEEISQEVSSFKTKDDAMEWFQSSQTIDA